MRPAGAWVSRCPACGFLAAALIAVTLIATHAFGVFHDDTENVDHRYVRALAVAGQLGQGQRIRRAQGRAPRGRG